MGMHSSGTGIWECQLLQGNGKKWESKRLPVDAYICAVVVWPTLSSVKLYSEQCYRDRHTMCLKLVLGSGAECTCCV